MKKIPVKLKESLHQYEIIVGNNLLANCGGWARKKLSDKTSRIVVVSNDEVFRLYGENVKRSFESSGFEVFVWLMEDGEEHKSFRSLENALKFFGASKLTRTDAVVALGGGVVGDLAGFAAAIYLRGIVFLQIPTTLLAMVDSSVGGKTAVNTEFGKNLVGAFYQPNGVLIDVETLKTLPTRELTAGFCEAVKQGAISSEKLFGQTAKFLENYFVENFANYFSDKEFLEDLEKLLAAQVAFKAEIVMQDEREDSARMDARSRKILNFGHTLAHALEKVTDYKYFKHGEAVGYGILFAAELSKTLDFFDKNKLKLLNDVVHRVGVLPKTNHINREKVLEAFAFDKKVIHDSLQWILLEDIGKPFIRQNAEISKASVEQALKKILEN